MLDMTQILSAFSTHSHVLTLSIARAIARLGKAADTDTVHMPGVAALFDLGPEGLHGAARA